VHLGDAQALSDLGLGEIPVEPQDQHPLLALGELLEVSVDSFHVDDVLDRLIVRAEQVTEQAGVVLVREGSVGGIDAEQLPGSRASRISSSVDARRMASSASVGDRPSC
jgi:hypothetical protein